MTPNLKSQIAILIILTLSIYLSSALPLSAQTAEEKIIAKEKGALDRWKTGDTFGFIDIAADEITYFDPGLQIRCTGLSVFRGQLFKCIYWIRNSFGKV